MSRVWDSLRSLLFAPGDDARKLGKALASGADAVIADLEDAVVPGAKESARRTVVEVFGGTARADSGDGAGGLRLVRVNAVDTGYLEADLAALGRVDVDGIMVPKATAAALDVFEEAGPPVLALIETAAGIRDAYEVAVHPRVAALMLGGADLAAEANLDVRSDGQELLLARSTLVFASTAAGIRAPFDVVHLDVRDGPGQEREAALARSVGFGGKACVHPAQLDGVHRVFTPGADEVNRARRIMAAYDEATARGDAVVLLDGRLVDPPIVARAQAVLTRVP